MKKNFMSAILIATLVTMAPAAFAGISNDKNGKSRKTENVSNTSNNIEVKYVGDADGSVFLMVTVVKTGNRVGLLRISDGFGEILHSERVTDNTYSRYIKVSPEELKSIEVSYDTYDGFGKKRFNLVVSRSEAIRIEEVAAN